MKNKIVIVTGSDDKYAGFLEGLLSSIKHKLMKFDLVVYDLDLSHSSKQMISSFKNDVCFVRPEWQRHIPGKEKLPEYKKIILSKPFMPQMIPGYDGYMYIDADIWFQDPHAIDDYISAGKTTGAAFAFEAHPSYRSLQKIRTTKFLNRLYVRGIKDYFNLKTRRMFGSRVADRLGIQPVLNGGIFYISANSPIWKLWQRYMMSANFSRQISDQTCLQVMLLEHKLPFTVMSAIYNWLPPLSLPLVDANTFELLDPVYPYQAIKVLHLVDSRTITLELDVTDGRKVVTTLTWHDFQLLRQQLQTV